MRELNVMEVEAVSGTGFFSRLGSMVLGAVTGASIGAAKGSANGGSGGGLLGFGLLGNAVGAIVGGVLGVVQGGLFGFVNDWDATVKLFNDSTKTWSDPTTSTPKV
ncbi:hypothetical protein [Andreprevotia chitinilytica]|uniref:hypothetical protein n=1 Tax=Andreprevotia chitinilytica TaxID=396808 RepID=UPI0005510F6F|nr:hypothetical protein [Andreprevotia chitinilytica]